MKVLSNSLGVQPRTLVSLEGSEIVGILPLGSQRSLFGGKRLVSLPFSHRVSPLGTEKFTDALVERARQISVREDYSYFEIRSSEEIRNGVSDSRFVTTEALLPQSRDDLKDIIRSNHLGAVKQALKNTRVRLKLATEHDDFQAMDKLMAVNRRTLGSLTYPRGYFYMLWKYLRPYLRCELCLFDERPVAMMVSSVFGNTAIYHYGASRGEKEILRLRPNNLLVWNALKWAQDKGAEKFDFGTSLYSQKGLIFFKEGWGGETRPVIYNVFCRGHVQKQEYIQQDGIVGRTAAHVLRIIPLRIYRNFSPILLRIFG
jgi:hypothetical protein